MNTPIGSTPVLLPQTRQVRAVAIATAVAKVGYRGRSLGLAIYQAVTENA